MAGQIGTITLSDKQSAAVRAILAWYTAPGAQVFYLAGYAGTGKSTTCAYAIEELKAKHIQAAMALQRLSEAFEQAPRGNHGS